MGKDLAVAVASTSEIKLNAVKQAFFERGLPVASLAGYAAPSDVNAQPFGEIEIIQGCRNRFMHLLQVCKTADVFVAIENGIQRYGYFYVDWAYILVIWQGYDKHPVSTWTHGVQIAPRYIKMAKELPGGLATNTVGQVIASLYPEAQADDPHYWLTGVRREELIAAALTDLLKQHKDMFQ